MCTVTENKPIICFDHVSYQYDGMADAALSDICLSVHAGEFLAVVGHNGSGKSTLSKHLNALLLPTEGTVTVFGMDTRDSAMTLQIRQQVGMVFQNPDNQLVTTIVEEDVAFGPENLGVPPKEIRQRVDRALDAVNMRAFAEHAAHRLSGGQKQRIAIAGMLAMRPNVLVLDEATAMLDPQGRMELLDTVKRLNREDGITVIMITQYMEEVVDCSRVIALCRGRVALEGSPREVFRDPVLLKNIGLDAPEIVNLRDELRLRSVPLSDTILKTEELADALCPLLLKN